MVWKIEGIAAKLNCDSNLTFSVFFILWPCTTCPGHAITFLHLVCVQGFPHRVSTPLPFTIRVAKAGKNHLN
jgi:hypothetical protein